MRALLIGTKTAIDCHESGTSLRLKSIKNLLSEINFEVTIVEKKLAKTLLRDHNFDVIVLSSYSCASLGRLARKRTKTLWFDPYDSWINSRLSLAKHGNLSALLALARDVFWITIFPKREITTFISINDSKKHSRFTKKDVVFVLPINFEKIKVSDSQARRLVFVGDGNYIPNRRSLKFLNQLGEKLNENILIVGRNYSNQEKYKNCTFLGYIPSEELFKSQDIILAPISDGAGIKTKVALPLFLGLRVVANAKSANGILRNDNLKVVETVSDFALAVSEFKGIQNTKFDLLSEHVYEVDETLNLIDFLKSYTLKSRRIN